ncbi:hypothetical protein ACQJBY_005986 [Aegilops geniculata]
MGVLESGSRVCCLQPSLLLLRSQGTASDGREKGRAKRPAVWVGAARPKTRQWTPHGVEERPAIGKSSIFMDEILTTEDGAHGRSLEDVKGRREEWSKLNT